MSIQLNKLVRYLKDFFGTPASVDGMTADKLVEDIVKICDGLPVPPENVGVVKARILSLSGTLHAATDEGNPNSQDEVTQVMEVLKTIRKRAQRWKGCEKGALISDMNRCVQEIDQKIADGNLQKSIQTQETDIRDFLRQLREQPAANGTPELQERMSEAKRLLKLGQETLIQKEGPPSESSHDLNKLTDLKMALGDLQRSANIIPPVKNMNGQVDQAQGHAITQGPHCDIGEGLWMGRVKVALKTLRHVMSDNEEAREDFMSAIAEWSQLCDDPAVGHCWGIATDLGRNMTIIAPWRNDILTYISENPTANRIQLLQEAAESLQYLHSKGMIHGNVKCSNIWVSDSGKACIGDFGLTNLIDNLKNTGGTTKMDHTVTRWLAPEIITGDPQKPSKASDAYSLGMAMFEILTGQTPFADLKSDVAVIRALMNDKLPARPTEGSALTDDLWKLLVQCWSKDPEARPTMQVVVAKLGEYA